MYGWVGLGSLFNKGCFIIQNTSIILQSNALRFKQPFTRGGARGPVNMLILVFIGGGIQSVYVLMEMSIQDSMFLSKFKELISNSSNK